MLNIALRLHVKIIFNLSVKNVCMKIDVLVQKSFMHTSYTKFHRRMS